MTRDDMARACVDTVPANNLRRRLHPPSSSPGGSGSLGLDPRKTSDPQVIIIADSNPASTRTELYDQGLKIVTAGHHPEPSRRPEPAHQDQELPQQHPREDRGHRRRLPRSPHAQPLGLVAECTGDNLFVVSRGRLHTLRSTAGILEGITRQPVIELSTGRAFRFVDRTMDRHDLYTADECFLTGSAAEVIPVVECDARPIGVGRPGPVTKDLHRRFHALVRGELMVRRSRTLRTVVIEIRKILAQPTSATTPRPH